MLELFIAVLCILAGGVGGYLYGRKVEAEASAAIAQLRSTAQRAGNAVERAGSDLKKGV